MVHTGRLEQGKYAKVGFADGDNLDCFCCETQTMTDLASCPACPNIFTREDLMAATDRAFKVGVFRSAKI